MIIAYSDPRTPIHALYHATILQIVPSLREEHARSAINVAYVLLDAGARVIIAVAGMEGALPSLVAGLVGTPVVAVPTSVGYGASFGGLSALLTMLTTCSPGIGVVNIDNGFGAAALASRINQLGAAEEHDAADREGDASGAGRPEPGGAS